MEELWEGSICEAILGSGSFYTSVEEKALGLICESIEFLVLLVWLTLYP